MIAPRLRDQQWDVVLVSLAVLALGAGYVGWRVITPATCAWLGPDAASWTPQGLVPRLAPGCELVSAAPVVAVEQSASSAVLQFADGVTASLPLTPQGAFVLRRLGDGVWTLTFTVLQFALCSFGFIRRPTDRAMGAALVFATGLLTSTTVTLIGLPIGHSSDWPRWLFLANTQVVFSLVWGAVLLFVVLFPTPIAVGADALPRRAATASAPLVIWLLITIAILAATHSDAARMHYAIVAQTSVTAFTMLAIMAGLIVRSIKMRQDTSDVVGRQQVLWLAATGLSALLGALAFWIVPQAVTGVPLLPRDLIGVPGLVFVLGLGIALLRFRMFELEWLLVRVLVDTVIVLAAVGVYELLLRVLGAAPVPPEYAGLGAFAAMVIALTAPAARRRVELAANWVVYREPDSPYQTLSKVAESLNGRSIDFQRVADDIRRALRLPQVEIRAEGIMAVSGTTDAVPGALPVSFPLEHGQRGEDLVVHTRGRGDRLAQSEMGLLRDLARQIGIAVHQLRLSAQLQRSREQLVLAREEERRSIRRIVHDDLAPTMAGIALQSETARRLASRADLADVIDPVLGAISRDAQNSSEALRALSYELRPPALDERGLVAALEDAGAGMTQLKVQLDIDLGDPAADPLPAAVEVAVYRIAVEALRNVARHAAANSCRVSLRRSSAAVVLQVADDGIGPPAELRAGVGLTAMRERAAELGGELSVAASREGGTLIHVELPLGGER